MVIYKKIGIVLKKSLSFFFITLSSIIFAQDTTKQISINLPSGIDIDLKGKVEFEFVDVEGEGGAINLSLIHI